ncbi:hypothetical protein [Actinokineospora inagensis]|uniref:hypothetical protein n=1 Tax=Actinokineospora inagensis TaxID=103730 RepID=UPI0012FC4358|nr:hypothetical protein [Actinokineospora inagensis]
MASVHLDPPYASGKSFDDEYTYLLNGLWKAGAKFYFVGVDYASIDVIAIVRMWPVGCADVVILRSPENAVCYRTNTRSHGCTGRDPLQPARVVWGYREEEDCNKALRLVLGELEPTALERAETIAPADFRLPLVRAQTRIRIGNLRDPMPPTEWVQK